MDKDEDEDEDKDKNARSAHGVCLASREGGAVLQSELIAVHTTLASTRTGMRAARHLRAGLASIRMGMRAAGLAFRLPYVWVS